MKKNFCLVLFCFIAVLFLGEAHAKPNVVATTGMIGDVVGRIGGDRLVVKTMMGPGVDPHLYKPTRADMATLMKADLVFYHGLLLEGKMQDVFIRLAGSGKKIIAVTAAIPEKNLLSPPEFQGHVDPHVWMDPLIWMTIAPAIVEHLVQLDPGGKNEFEANAKAWQAEVKLLHQFCEKIIRSIPNHSRLLVTAHDAFNYFGRRYGLDVAGIQGISTESEAGIQDIEKLVGVLVARKVPAVFVETTVADRNIKALIEGAGAKNHRVILGGRLYSDALGPVGQYQGTYIGMIDHNATTIAMALGGRTPKEGFAGKLVAGGGS